MEEGVAEESSEEAGVDLTYQCDSSSRRDGGERVVKAINEEQDKKKGERGKGEKCTMYGEYAKLCRT